MRRLVAVLFCVWLGISASGQQKQRFGYDAKPVNPADYPLTVHVTHSFVSGPLNLVHLDAVINGRKLQLESQDSIGLLHVGDYKAHLAKDDEKKSGTFFVTYELLFNDGTHWFFNVVAESE